MTAPAAAELLGCSRPHFLEAGYIPFTKIGQHRRVRYEDVLAYTQTLKANQKKLLIDRMKADEESGWYDT